MKLQAKRCAIYTRKSSEEGLDQEFNSLDAQREAGEAYVKSQSSEGWRVVSTLYDDGGFSGGSMERPALKRLLTDIAAGLVDVVVVYKIDRLTRSLADFARIVELFDRHSVSFVSVTQSFNTTSSMGRLTLNVLLSFAQFEREVTGERIRDKIAASKAKGMWMGGVPPLGYDPPADGSRTLLANEAEAEIVRRLFDRYLELGSVHALKDWADEHDIWSKQRVTRSGRTVGGLPFSRGALFHLLRNPVYRGMIVHKGTSYPGAHPAIVDEKTFAAVQAMLDANAGERRSKKALTRAPLTGRIFDAHGYPMSPTFSRGASGKLYRYYVSAPLQQGHRQQRREGQLSRVPGEALEAILMELLDRILPGRETDVLSVVARIELHPGFMHVLLPSEFLPYVRRSSRADEEVALDVVEPLRVRFMSPMSIRLRGGGSWIETTSAERRRPEQTMVKALRAAHRIASRGSDGMPFIDHSPGDRYRRSIARLAFLAPDIQAAILEGKQPAGLTLERLVRGSIPHTWVDQRQLLACVFD